MSKRQIFILGMHRSGTSVVAHLLKQMGAVFGTIEDELSSSIENPKGFWERKDVLAINDELLQKNLSGSEWFNVHTLRDRKPEAGTTISRKIQTIINSLGNQDRTWFIKDPRFSFTFPWWQPYLDNPIIILPFRDPTIVARSLFERNKIPFEYSLALWNEYFKSAVSQANNIQSLIITDYDELITNPIKIARGLFSNLQHLGATDLTLPAEETIISIVDKRLNRSGANSKAIPEVPQQIQEFIRVLKSRNSEAAYNYVGSSNNNEFARFIEIESDKITEIIDRANNGKNWVASTVYIKEEKEEFSIQKSIRIAEKRTEQSIINFHIPLNLSQGNRYRVDIINDLSIIQIQEIVLTANNEKVIIDLSTITSNAILTLNNWYLFDTNPSSIYFEYEPDETKKITSIELNVYILGSGINILPHINDFHKNYIQWRANNNIPNKLAVDFTSFPVLMTLLTEETITHKFEKQRLIDLSQEILKTTNKLNTLNSEKLNSIVKSVSTLSIIEGRFNSIEDKFKENEKLKQKNEYLEALIRKFLEEVFEIIETKFSSYGNENTIKTLESNHSNILQEVVEFIKETIENKDAAELKSKELQNISEAYHEIEKEKQRYIEDFEGLLDQQDNYLYHISNLEQQIKDIKRSLSFTIGQFSTYFFRKLFDVLTRGKPFNQTHLWWIKQHLTNPAAILGNAAKREELKKIWTKQRNETSAHIINSERRAQGASGLDSRESQTTITPDQKTVINSNSESFSQDTEINNRKRILYISPSLPEFDTSSGGKRAAKMLKILAKSYEVFAFSIGSKPEKYIKYLEGNNIIVIRTSSHREVKRKIPHFDTIIFAWFETYYTSNHFKSLYPDAQIILDSVDVHWVREERSLGIWEGLTKEKVLSNKQKEIQAYKEADIVWAVTENDKEAILHELPNCDVRVVSNIHEPIRTVYSDPSSNSILFIGGYNHYPNVSAAILLAKEIFPKIIESIPNAKLIIAGSNAPLEIQELGAEAQIEYVGFVPEEKLSSLYENSAVAAIPLLTGAGIKGKICEAIAYMTPVVTNDIGNEGINLIHEEEGFIGDNPSIASHIIKILKGEYNLENITKNAQKKLAEIVGPDIAEVHMIESITPQISICIVTWNKLDLLRRCIESIEGNTIYPNYRILVYSNGCSDGTTEYLKAASRINSNIIPIFSKTNDVFVIPNNKMMKMLPNNDIVLVNNDVYVTRGWLSALHETAYSSKDYGIVGSKILYPDGRLQEFGSELYANGTGRNIGKFDNPDKAEYKVIQEVGYVSGCAMYIKKATIDSIGVFDEQFNPCYCEDSDYCYTAKENGIKTVVTPESIVFHEEGGTSGTDTSVGMKRYQVVNMEKFINKHRDKKNGIVWQTV